MVVGGVKFDSVLEHHLHTLLTINKVKFDFQYKYTLIPKFRFRNENVREMAMIIDFKIYIGSEIIYADTKGYANETAPLKYKMLKYHMKDAENVDILWLKDKKEVSNFVYNLISKKNEQSEQSFIDW